MTEKQIPTVTSVSRAIDILNALGAEDMKSIRELSNDLDITKSTIHRLLQTLEVKGMVKKDSTTEKYGLGYNVLELGKNLVESNVIRNVAHSFMLGLSDETGDTVQLALVENDEILIIEKIDGMNEIRVFAQAGQKYPITYGSFGKIFMSSKNDKEMRELLKDIENNESIIKEIIEIKNSKVAVGIDTPIRGAISLATPIFDSADEIIAAISVAGVKTEEKMNNLEQLEDVIREYGVKISKALSQ